MNPVTPQDAFTLICSRARGTRFAIAFDYDGTLTEIAPYPPLARLTDVTRRCLLDLVGRPGLHVALITGRSLNGLSAVAGDLPGVVLATNGGLSISHGKQHWEHPRAADSSALLLGLADQLKAELRPWPGAFVEDKGLTFTVHFRQEPAASQAISSLVQRAIAGACGRLRLVPGRMSIEVQPSLAWDKGHVLTTLLERWGLQGDAVYFGDDTIDEPAFQALRKRGGLTFHVGDSRRESCAEFQLNGVVDLLEVVYRLKDSDFPIS